MSEAPRGVADDAAVLRRVLETVPLAIAVFDMPSQRVLQLNQMAEAFFGQPATLLLGRAPAQWPSAVPDIAGLQASLDLASESPPGVRREVVRALPEGGQARIWDTRFVAIGDPAAPAGRADPLQPGPPDHRLPEAFAARGSGPVLMVGDEVTDLRAAEQERFDAAIAQRGMLVQEVHHRIKNNLQGVAGLLQQASARVPEVAPILSEAVGQLQAIAQVYGLQVGSSGPVPLAGLLQAVAASVQRTFNHPIESGTEGDEVERWRLPEAESIPVALTANELLTNAIKHGGVSPVRCRLRAGPGDVVIEIINRGRLREGVDPAAVPAGASGLGLVRALLPRRSAELTLQQQGDDVVTRVLLRPPAVRKDG
jgi:two-component sensor histidine kinase